MNHYGLKSRNKIEQIDKKNQTAIFRRVRGLPYCAVFYKFFFLFLAAECNNAENKDSQENPRPARIFSI